MSKENAPGFLSKVARFVRKPLTNWSDLDQPEVDKASDYSKAVLKEMIERKRRNDFVRKREFDQLRKLRNRGNVVADSPGPISFFSSSLPAHPEERAVTLKKIDEIEAQMSQQWWKGKSASTATDGEMTTSAAQSLAPAGGQVHPAVVDDDARAAAEAPFDDAFHAVTQPLDRSASAPVPSRSDVPALFDTLPMSERERQLSRGASQGFESGRVPLNEPASATQQGFVHDPELEEPAILFANGDHEAAEAALLALIAPSAAGAEHPPFWLALFDLYRAIGRYDRFDGIAIDFANRFGRSAPVWFSMAESTDPTLAAGETASAATSTPRAFSWIAPDVLSGKALSALGAALAKSPRQPWRLAWTKLSSIEAGAHTRLLEVIEQWCVSQVRLRFVDAQRLEQVLADLTPVGDDAVDPVFWRLRLATLRLMGRTDAFDQVALDYCITYEVSPPSWVAPACIFLEAGQDSDANVALDSEGHGGMQSALHSDFQLSLPTAPGETPEPLETGSAQIELSGQLLGDANDRLGGVDSGVPRLRSLQVRCDNLARVDFSAAGSVLNWVAARQADGIQVEFINLQRLVAVFFNVVGINEHARIAIRQS